MRTLNNLQENKTVESIKMENLIKKEEEKGVKLSGKKISQSLQKKNKNRFVIEPTQ